MTGHRRPGGLLHPIWLPEQSSPRSDDLKHLPIRAGGDGGPFQMLETLDEIGRRRCAILQTCLDERGHHPFQPAEGPPLERRSAPSLHPPLQTGWVPAAPAAFVG